MSQFLGNASPFAPRSGRIRTLLVGSILFFALALFLFVGLKQNAAGPSISLSTFYGEVRKSNVASINLDGDEISGTFRTPLSRNAGISNFRTPLPPGLSGNWEFVHWLMDNSGAEVRVEQTNSTLSNMILPLIPWLLILMFIWFIAFPQLRKFKLAQKPMRVVVVDPEEK
jgi:ATP-dependent Zn protease